jgi:hypothetical protein
MRHVASSHQMLDRYTFKHSNLFHVSRPSFQQVGNPACVTDTCTYNDAETLQNIARKSRAGGKLPELFVKHVQDKKACHSERSEESLVGTHGFFAALRMTGNGNSCPDRLLSVSHYDIDQLAWHVDDLCHRVFADE